MNVKTVAILGAGNGGITAAADLAGRGFDVRLYETPSFAANLEGILEKGGVLLKTPEGESFHPIPVVTTNLEEAVTGAEVVMLTVPGFAIESFAELLAPLLTGEQVVFLNGAAAMGCVRFVKRAREMGIDTPLKIAETNSLTYGTRAFPEEAIAEMSLRVKKLFFSAYPAEDTGALLDICAQLYDCLVPADNIWQTTLENGNPEVHPGPSLLNAGRIDFSGGEFWLYREGITEHTVNVLRAIEQERLALGKAFGLRVEGAVEARYNRGYFDNDQEDLQALFNRSEVFTQIKGPVSVQGRYFTEDISSGLVLWSDLGKAAGVPTPNIDAVITLGGTLLKRNFYEEGLTLKKLGFDGLTVNEMISAV